MFLPLLSKHTAKQKLSPSHAKGNTEVVDWPWGKYRMLQREMQEASD